MTQKEFEQQFDQLQDDLKNLVIKKGKEYVRNDNPFHNFEKGALLENKDKTLILHGFLLKHLISYFDIIKDIEENKLISMSQFNEKLQDIIVYFMLLKIMENE